MQLSSLARFGRSLAGALLVAAAALAGCGPSGPLTTLDPEWQACTGAGQCVLREKTCCRSCGGEPVGQDFALNQSHLAELDAALCGSGEACPALDCALGPDFTTAVCRSGACAGVDVRQDPMSACASDADCQLRWGINCCEPCIKGETNAATVVSVNHSGDLEKAVCSGAESCGACPGRDYPSTVKAVCSTVNKHCEVLLAK